MGKKKIEDEEMCQGRKWEKPRKKIKCLKNLWRNKQMKNITKE